MLNNNLRIIEGLTKSNDNASIQYQLRGSGQPALVFVHGWSCDQSYWNAQLTHFGNTHTVIAMDLAGHGASGTRRDAYSMASFGQDVAAVVRHLNLEQIILIGHSMGGDVILEAARLLEDETKGLIGVDTFHDVEDTFTEQGISEFITPFTSDYVNSTRDFVRKMFTKNANPNLVEEIVSRMSSTSPTVGVDALMRVLLSYPSTQILARIQKPIFAINADGWVPTNLEGATRANIEVIMLQGYGHFLHMEAPEYFNQALADVVYRITNADSQNVL